MFDSYQLVERSFIVIGLHMFCGFGLMIFSFVIILICTGCPVDLQVIVGWVDDFPFCDNLIVTGMRDLILRSIGLQSYAGLYLGLQAVATNVQYLRCCFLNSLLMIQSCDYLKNTLSFYEKKFT